MRRWSPQPSAMSNWRNLTDRLEGKAPPGTPRSGQWRKLRDEFLSGSCCEVCGGKKSLVAHHEIPFHLAPELELEPSNLMALCEAKRFGINCHLLLGHLGNWRRTNVNARADIAYWREKLR
jgi:5-methylcytosine-specific restriction enzyme A